jgi:hypothetical protein
MPFTKLLSYTVFYHHYHKHQGLGHLARSVSRVTAALSTVSSVSQLFSFLADCSGMILKIVFYSNIIFHLRLLRFWALHIVYFSEPAFVILLLAEMKWFGNISWLDPEIKIWYLVQ